MYLVWKLFSVQKIFLNGEDKVEIFFQLYMAGTVDIFPPDMERLRIVEAQSHFFPGYLALEDFFSILSFHFHITKLGIILFTLCIAVRT